MQKQFEDGVRAIKVDEISECVLSDSGQRLVTWTQTHARTRLIAGAPRVAGVHIIYRTQ